MRIVLKTGRNINTGIDNSISFFSDNISRKWYTWLAYSALSLDIIIRFILILLKKLPLGSIISALFVPVLFIFLIYKNQSREVLNNIRASDWCFILLFYLYVGISFILNTSAREYISYYWEAIFLTAPLYFLFGLTFPCDRKMKNAWLVLSKVIIFVDLAYVIYALGGAQTISEDSMERAYRMIPGVMLLTAECFETKKAKDLLWAIGGTLYVLTCGTRGPVLVLLVYWLYCLLFVGSNTLWRKIFGIAAIIAVVLIYYSPVYYQILNSISNIASGFGLSTRVFTEAMSGTFISNDNGRNRLYEIGLQMIRDNPFGYGIYGEWSYMGWNVHQFYLQFLIHFGVFFGPILIIMLIALVMRAYVNNPNHHAQNIIMIFACFVFVKGFAGGTYIDWQCAFLIGLCIREVRNKREIYPYVKNA